MIKEQPEHLRYWSSGTNPETGEQFEIYKDTLLDLGNPDFDLDRYLRDDYAAEQTKRLDRRFRFTPEPMGEECLSYYRSIGLKKEMFDADGFFTRWVMFTPLEMEEGRKYPLIIILHGGMNTIETEEFSDGFTENAAREGYMIMYPQDTRPESVQEKFDCIKAKYPVDTERVYLTGFSQGGYMSRELIARRPELFAAYAPTGNDLYRPFDFFNRPYTEEQREHLKDTFVPFLQIVGCNEPNFHVPRYQWRPRLTKLQDLRARFPGQYDNVRPGIDFSESEHGPDVTYPYDENGKRMPTVHPAPEAGEDIPRWAANRINLRLDLLGCEPRDIDVCTGYAENADTELHKVLGFYGDKDSVLMIHGRKHYVSDIWNRDGIHAFRYVAVDNAPHWPYICWAEIGWEFFRKFRRDSETGKIVES